MVIRNLEYLEVASEVNSLTGGFSSADANAIAQAAGRFFADTSTFTRTATLSAPGAVALSTSNSSSDSDSF